ncbi:MAG: N-acetylmuramoyl-L-alanine amidase [Candidatus Omnitrophota bacterium]|nr:MAG: N-acetylmuramoyl-L-alanine amidase [Candidatus Omnitrophota bacterium]
MKSKDPRLKIIDYRQKEFQAAVCGLWFVICVFFVGCAAPSYRGRSFTYQPSDYIKINEFCNRHGFQYSFDTLDEIVKFTSPQREVRLILNSGVGYFNGRILSLRRPPLYREGKILLPKELDNAISSQEIISFKPSFSIKTIVVDPGHGGRDPGATSSRGLEEKNLNLKVSKYLKEELERRGFKVILTRSRDTYLTLEDRVRVAKKYNADLFISIHANSNRARSINGTEIYYLSPSRLNSRKRAAKLARAHDFGRIPRDAKAILWDLLLTKNYALSVESAHSLYFTFKNLGFKVKPPLKAPFYVLRFAYVPSILVEMGYLSNRYEEKILRRRYYQKQIAEAVALGIVSLNKRYISQTVRKP